MTKTDIDVYTVLQAEDVEGLIAGGAPDDEYASEAREIAPAVALLDQAQLTEDNIVAIIALVWAKSFNLSNQDLAKRMQAFHNVAQRLL